MTHLSDDARVMNLDHPPFGLSGPVPDFTPQAWDGMPGPSWVHSTEKMQAGVDMAERLKLIYGPLGRLARWESHRVYGDDDRFEHYRWQCGVLVPTTKPRTLDKEKVGESEQTYGPNDHRVGSMLLLLARITAADEAEQLDDIIKGDKGLVDFERDLMTPDRERIWSADRKVAADFDEVYDNGITKPGLITIGAIYAHTRPAEQMRWDTRAKLALYWREHARPELDRKVIRMAILSSNK